MDQQTTGVSKELIESLAAALQQLSLSRQTTPQQSQPATEESSHFSSHFYNNSLRGIKYPTYDGTRSQEKVNDFINLFAVVRSLNNLSDSDLVRLAVQHLRGDALLWWIELSETKKAQQLLSDWGAFKAALRRQFVQWNAASADTQKLIYGLRQFGSARAYFQQLRHIRIRIPDIPASLLFNIIYANVKPHCRAALTRLQQLRGSEDLSLEEIEEECIREDEAEFARGFRQPNTSNRPQQPTKQWWCPICGDSHTWKECPKKKPSGCPSCGGSCRGISSCPTSFSTKRRTEDKQKMPTKGAFLPTSRPASKPTSGSKSARTTSTAATSISQQQVDKLAVSPRPTISAQVIKTNSLVSNPKQLVFEGTINKHPVTFLLDGGADHSIISKAFAINSGIIMHPLDQPISTTFANSSTETIRHATAPLELQCQGHHSTLQPLVSSNVSFDLLVGLDWLSRYNPRVDWDTGTLMLFDDEHCYKWQATYSDAEFQDGGLAIRLCSARQLRAFPTENENYINYVATVAKVDPEESAGVQPSPAVLSILQDFPAIQEEPSSLPPERNHQHPIPLVPKAQPVRKSPYRLQPRELQHLQSCLSQWLSSGWIRPSSSSWASPVFFVSKKNGELRLVVDYRGLNSQTQPDKFPLPRIDALIDNMSGAKVFTRLDLRNGFYQIRMKPGDIYKTSFSCPLGLYEWTVMPMGLINAPASFQRVMTDIFKDLQFVQVYMDDIVVHSGGHQDHYEHLRQVFQRLNDNDFRLNISKCTFEANSIDFLGFHLSGDGVQPLPANVASIYAMPPVLSSRTQVRRFLGMANYYSHFVPHFSSVAAPLHQLTSNTTPFAWNPSCTLAVSNIKQLLSEAPVLAIFSPALATRITCDASAFGIGAILEQQHPDGWHPVHFLSRTFSKAENNYPVIDKEWLAVIYAMTKWRHYLHQHFVIRTDHKPLVALLSKSSAPLQDRRARWMDLCLQYPYTVEHVAGKENVVADVLSRLSAYMEPSASVACTASAPAPFDQPSGTPYPLALTSASSHARDSLSSDIRRYREEDPLYMGIYNRIREPQPPEQFSLHDDLLYFNKSRLVIPKHPVLRTRLIAEHHDSSYSGHLGRDRTTEFLSRGFYWPSLNQDVEDYIKTCDTCMRNKITRHPANPPLVPITAPSRWHTVCLDVLGPFIPNAPTPPGANTCILVFMDKLTKMLRLAACPQQLSAEHAANLFIEHVFRHHGLPRRLLSDQGPQFTSSFWKHVFAALQTKVVNTTPYYPQGNGQVERANRTIVEGLRAFVNSRKDDWEKYLHLFEFAYNNTVHSATKTTPFFLNYGRHPTTIASLLNPELPPDLFSENAADFLDKLHSAVATAQECINAANKKAAARSKGIRKPFSFKVGDFVLISSKCFRATRKLDPPYVGPFRLVRQVTPQTFELEGLPAGCATVWNIRHFKPYYMSSEKHQAYRQQAPPPVSPSTPDIYEVDHISDCWQKRDGLYYLVHWKGYPNPTWEPLKNLSGCPDSIKKYHKSTPFDESLHSVPPRDRHRLRRSKRATTTPGSEGVSKPKRIRTSHFALRAPFLGGGGV